MLVMMMDYNVYKF